MKNKNFKLANASSTMALISFILIFIPFGSLIVTQIFAVVSILLAIVSIILGFISKKDMKDAGTVALAFFGLILGFCSFFISFAPLIAPVVDKDVADCIENGNSIAECAIF